MRKRIFKITAILFIVLTLTAGLLCGCDKDGSVSSIQIVQGSFKESYALDEALNLQNAKILVTYSNGKTANVAITESMVSGFDTSKTTMSATITVTYKDKSANFIYKVTNTVSVETYFRFRLEVNDSTEHAGLDVNVKTKNVSKVEKGVYAMRFTISTTGGIVLSDLKLALDGKFAMSVYSVSVNSAVVVIYSSDGYECVPDESVILKLKATKPSEKGTVNIQNASISDGETDFIVPAVTYNYGG